MAGQQSPEKSVLNYSPARAGRSSIWPPLFAAVFCTGLIVEAIFTAARSRANGDMMLLFVPLLGAAFLSIWALQAWWACLKILRSRRGE
jgi:hypothetical protein